MVPSLFVCHGSPALAMEKNDYTDLLGELGRRFQPASIVIFTAHWESDVTTISFHDDVYETIYDFYGFPDEMYRMKYPAKGSTAVASLVEQKLNARGIPSRKDESRGLDHGSWVVLKLMYPDADIPVVQVSVNPFLHPEKQFEIGAALRDLGRENILIIGSGGTSHNLRMVNRTQTSVEPWTEAFDQWLIDHLMKRDLDSLFQYEKMAPYADLAVPRAEHFVPLFIALGSGDETRTPKLLHRSYRFGTLSHIIFQFGN